MGFNFLKNGGDNTNSAKVTVVGKTLSDTLLATESYIVADQLQYVLTNLIVISELLDNKELFDNKEHDIFIDTKACWLAYAKRIEQDFADYLKTQFDNGSLSEDEWPFIHKVYKAKNGDMLEIARELILVARYGLNDTVIAVVPFDFFCERIVKSIESVYVEFDGKIQTVTFNEQNKLFQAIMTIVEMN